MHTTHRQVAVWGVSTRPPGTRHHPKTRHPPGTRHPWDQTPPGDQCTPLGGRHPLGPGPHPLGADLPGSKHPPGADTPAPGEQNSLTHAYIRLRAVINDTDQRKFFALARCERTYVACYRCTRMSDSRTCALTVDITRLLCVKSSVDVLLGRSGLWTVTPSSSATIRDSASHSRKEYCLLLKDLWKIVLSHGINFTKFPCH